MSEISIINKSYEVYKAVFELARHLEKPTRYSVGTNLEQSVLNMIEVFVMAKHAPKSLKTPYLLKGIGHLESARLKLRLLLELQLANETNIFKIQEDLADIGRQLGGWLRSLEK